MLWRLLIIVNVAAKKLFEPQACQCTFGSQPCPPATESTQPAIKSVPLSLRKENRNPTPEKKKNLAWKYSMALAVWTETSTTVVRRESLRTCNAHACHSLTCPKSSSTHALDLSYYVVNYMYTIETIWLVKVWVMSLPSAWGMIHVPLSVGSSAPSAFFEAPYLKGRIFFKNYRRSLWSMSQDRGFKRSYSLEIIEIIVFFFFFSITI